MHHPPHCPRCSTNDYVFVYSQQRDFMGLKITIVYACLCGCVFSRQVDASDSGQGSGESAQ
jgi:hypothetical protein